jgi:hypothetical protein
LPINANIEGSSKIKHQKNRNPINKRIEQFSKDKIQMVHKCLTSLAKNCSEIPSHPRQNSSHQENEQQMLVRMQGSGMRRRDLIHCWWGYKFMKPVWHQYRGSQKTENRTTL